MSARNVVFSALSLARCAAKNEEPNGDCRDGRLTKIDLQEVVEITEDFQEQLGDITKDARDTSVNGSSSNRTR